MLPFNDRKFKIEQGNAFDLITRVEPGSINLTITSPPYNIGKVYEKRTTLQKYLSQFTQFAADLYKATPTSRAASTRFAPHPDSQRMKSGS
jgi:adenine-specific DNA-methyltransferase